MSPEAKHRVVPTDRASGKRLEIQGLRAIAVMLVVVYHLWPSRLPGGYIGVDVFFVISGFLITSHLMREATTHGRVRLAQFWARRARRLLPGAYLVLAATTIGTWLWVPQSTNFFKGIVASTLYVENWSLARDAVDYLAQENAPTPTQHFWSLSAEEQFYLVWPVLVTVSLLLAARLSRSRSRWSPRAVVLTVLATVTVASLVYSLHLTATDPQRAFFVTPTRAWEFGAGALLAFVPAAALGRTPTAARAVLAWAGIGTILVCAVVLDGSTPMPGTAAIVVVVGALLVLAAGDPPARWSVTRALGVRPVQLTGDISYALYLWHWPLIILLPYAQGHPSGNLTLVLVLLATFVLATASTYLVENPIRSGRFLHLRLPAVTLAFTVVGAVALVLPSAYAVHQEDQLSARARAVAADFAQDPPRCAGAASHDPSRPCDNPVLDRVLVPNPKAAYDDRPQVEGQHCASREPDEPIVPCHGGDWDDPSIPKVAIIGDSHARMMSTAVDALAKQGLLAWDGYFQSGCLWSTDPPHRTKYGRQCRSFKDRLPAILASDPGKYDFVITTGRVSKLDGTTTQKAAGLVAAWKEVTDAGTPVVALTDTPEIGEGVTDCLLKTPRTDVATCARRRSAALPTPDPMLTAGRTAKNSHAIDLRPYYCSATTCPAVIGGVTVYADTNHLTATYVSTLAPILERKLISFGLLKAR